ncbi:MAG: hypothetical protein J5930_02205 [Treponema sp.]|nr:hypothetical protein [Treponema sp.]
MDVQAVILSAYLLFPVISKTQMRLDAAAGRPVMNEEERRKTRVELIATLDAYTYENALKEFAQADMEVQSELGLLSEDLENPEYGPQSPFAALGLSEGGYAEMIYRNSKKRLAFFTYGEEAFTAQETFEGGKTVVSVNGSQFSRSVYDDFYRLVSRTVWKNASTSAESKIIRREILSYGLSSSRIPVSKTEEFIEDNLLIESAFTQSGKPVSIKTFSTKGGMKKSVRTLDYKYDGDGNIVSEEDTKWTGEETFNVKRLYTYSAGKKIPSVDLYENNEHRLHTDYEDELTYREIVYFPPDHSIHTWYRNGVKAEEAVFMGETELSRRTFDE